MSIDLKRSIIISLSEHFPDLIEFDIILCTLDNNLETLSESVASSNINKLIKIMTAYYEVDNYNNESRLAGDTYSSTLAVLVLTVPRLKQDCSDDGCGQIILWTEAVVAIKILTVRPSSTINI